MISSAVPSFQKKVGRRAPLAGGKWGILTPYHKGDWIFSALQAGLMPPEGCDKV